MVRSRNLVSARFLIGIKVSFSGHFSDLCFFFSFRLVFKESNFSEFMDSAYRTELVDFKESTTLQSSILVGFCLLPLEFSVILFSFKLFVPLFRNVWRLESPARIFNKSSLRFGIDKNAQFSVLQSHKVLNLSFYISVGPLLLLLLLLP